MKKNMLKVGAVVLALAFVIPAMSLTSPSHNDEEVIRVLVMLPGNAVGAEEVDYGNYVGKLIEDYDGFAVAEITQKQKDHLEAIGATVIIDENNHIISMDGYRFDTRVGEPVLDNFLKSRPRAGVEGKYIVQFIGPIKNEWLEGLLETDVLPVSYYPHNAMLVETTPEVKTSLLGLDHVQWVGDYHPAYKIRPEITEMNDGEKMDVKIIAYDPADVSTILESLNADDVMWGYEGEDLGLVKATLTLAQIESIATLNEVSYIEPIEEMSAMNTRIQWILQTNIANDRRIWNMGVNGSSQIVTMSDSGLDFDHNMYRESGAEIVISGHDIYNTTNTSRRKLIRYQPMAQWFDARGMDLNGNGILEVNEDPNGDGVLEALSDSVPTGIPDASSGHGTTTAGTLAGNDTGIGFSNNDGGAGGAKLYFQDVAGLYINPDSGMWDDNFMWIPDDYHGLFIDPYLNGSRVHSNSWGARSTDYTLDAMMIDKFMWEYPDFQIVFPTGNKEPSYPDVGSPATAKSVISVGWGSSSPNQNNVNGQSSTGPTADGRRKPTIVTPGFANTAMSTGNPWDNDFGSPDIETSAQGGSFASQAAGAAVALIRDYFVKGYYPTGTAMPGNELYPSAAVVRAMLMASGEMMTGGAADSKIELKYPNNSQGWGRPLLDNVLYFPGDARKTIVVNDTRGLLTGQIAEFEVNVLSDTQPLKAFLAWNDYPAAVGASPALVNNLDLQIEAPNSTKFWGNRFATAPSGPLGWLQRGYSIPGGSPDSVNTDEGINITTGNAQTPNWLTGATGVWKVRVIAQNIPAGPQIFGLVITGDIDMDYSLLNIDKRIYGDTDTINIQVTDGNLVAPNNYVLVTSTTEPSPENVTLTETAAGSGIWTGSIDTEFGLPVIDLKLQVKEEDIITVMYNDTMPVHVSTQTAVVDGSGPVITNVAVQEMTNAFAKITWDTDESSTSIVHYGETPSLEKTPVEFDALMVNHIADLTGLRTDTLYYFDVESADWFGHSTRDNNGGKHYTFRTVEKAEVLVIYGDDSFDAHEHYRTALDYYGWSYNEWYISTQGDPPLTTLQDYKVVMWQPGFEQYPPIADSQRPLITDYIDNGGRFFISSHDVAWALCDDGSQCKTNERCEWFNRTFRVNYLEDPFNWPFILGIPGNPISGDFSTAPGVLYVPTRDGAAGDEISCLSIDGLCTYTWWNTVSAFNPQAGYISTQWNSSAANGTSGIGVWGGMPSKILAYFFEYTRISPAIDNDPDREKILNNAIRWLLDDRDHPKVWVSFPNGGESFSASPVTISWNRATFGTAVATQSVYYSDNAGQSWIWLDDVDPLNSTYDWDISMRPNGNRYMVKVVVRDDGSPELLGADTSNSTFAINRPGGDLEGPVAIPGSGKIAPRYVDSGTSVWFNATIDDRDRGNSTIAEAEYFIQCTEPTVSQFGTGTAMTAADGSYDYPLEDVTWNGVIVLTSGWYTIWVHGRDAAGNWGTFDDETFLVLDGVTPVDLTPPAPPTNVMIGLEGATLENLNLTWDASADDDGTNVQFYDIFFSNAYAVNGTAYGTLTSVPATAAANYYFVHNSAGNGDPGNYFYYISARDPSCNDGINTTQVGKFNKALTPGKNLMSVPLMLYDESINVVLQTATYDIAWTYDATDPADPWKSYNPSKTVNDLALVNHRMALWIRVQANTNVVVVGEVPVTTTIQLQAGWNLVGYPSFIQKVIEVGLAGIGYLRLEGYDANSLENLRLLNDKMDNLVTGDGYWVKVDSSSPWLVDN
jgi:hypothetical protein